MKCWRDECGVNESVTSEFKGKTISHITSAENDDGDTFHMRLHFTDGTAADIHSFNDGSFNLETVIR